MPDAAIAARTAVDAKDDGAHWWSHTPKGELTVSLVQGRQIVRCFSDLAFMLMQLHFVAQSCLSVRRVRDQETTTSIATYVCETFATQ